jgi:predicted permease
MFRAFWTSFVQIIVPYSGLLLIMAVGVLAAWLHILTPERINVLSEIVIAMIYPIFTFYNIVTGSVTAVLNQAPFMVGLGLCGALSGYALATLIAHLNHWNWTKRSVCQVSGASGNTGFLGIPICTAIFGSQGTILAILYDFGASIYLLTLGIGSFQNSEQIQGSRSKRFISALKRIFNPILIALAIGLVISLNRIKIPDMAMFALKDLSGITIPVMLLILGGLIYNSFQKKRADSRGPMMIGVLKLMVVPILTWLVVSYLPLSATSQSVAVVEAAMPSAVTAVTFATRYQADEDLASFTTMLTTLVSIFTIPIFVAARMKGG